MPKYDNLSGKTFGRLYVEDLAGRAPNRTMLWNCVCVCGNKRVVRANHLKNDHTKSCGCLQKEYVGAKSIVGQVFGRLMVIGRSTKKVQRAAVWLCKCECGNYVEVHTASLRSGHTRSCGCYHLDVIWKGGVSTEPYCINWTKDFKNFIKERDNYRCLNPYCYKVDNLLAIHHIDYDKKNCHPSNLITVCRSCNSRANKDREWHKAWYQAIIYRRYNYGNNRY